MCQRSVKTINNIVQNRLKFLTSITIQPSSVVNRGREEEEGRKKKEKGDEGKEKKEVNRK